MDHISGNSGLSVHFFPLFLRGLDLIERSTVRLADIIWETKRRQRLGFSLALDDTGAGNAGLEMLSQ